MVHGLNPPLTPRRPGQLQVLCVARISTEKQDELSLEDQAGLHQHFVRENYAGDAAFEIVATCASGEHLDRQETQAIRDHIATRRFDLVVMEDLGRLLRDVDAVKLCGFCHDYETRLIAINDHVDTAQDNWQDMALFAAWRHTKYNEDTSRRIKQRLAERFIRDGKIVQCEIFGYLKPPICKDETDLKRDPAAETIYDQWFRKLEQGASYSEIADWLNVSGVKPGPYSRRNTWDCAMVARVTHNPILKGLRVRNRMITRKHHQSGHRISVKARPEDLKTRVCAHLAFIEPDRYDRVIRELDLRNSRYRRRMVDGADPLHGRPKKRTIWPGQHAICGICGRPMVYGGHGQKGHLVCRGNKEYVCWNGVSTDGLKASERIFHAVMDCITTLPDFDGQFRRQVQEMLANLTTSRATRETQLNQMHHELIRKRNNLLAALEECGPSPSLKDRLAELDRQAAELGAQRERLKALCTPTIAVPSMADLRKIAHAQLGSLDRRSPEFGRLMQGLLSSVTLLPYVLCDGGHPVLRAHVKLDLVALAPASHNIDGPGEKLQQTLMVDLFEVPQRAGFRAQVMALTAQGLRQRDIAAQLGITQPAVQRAVALDQAMRERRLEDPYVRLHEPPAADGRMRAHKHARFRFQPLGGAAGQAA